MTAPHTSRDTLRFEHKRRQLAVLATILVTPTVVFAAVDITLARHEPERLVVLVVLVVLRVMVITLFLIFAFGVTRLRDEARFDRAVTGFSYVAAFLALAVHLLRPPTLITPYFVEVVLIIGLYGMLPAHWRRQLGPCLLISGVGLVLLFVWHTEFDAIHRAAVAVALVLANAIGIALGWHQEWLAQRERQLAEQTRVSREALESTTAELRTLQKILPICSHCRNVRDTEGAWAELEAYVHRNLETRFSHGICPDCLTRHYPDEQTVTPR